LLKARAHLRTDGGESEAGKCLDRVLQEAERIGLLPEQIHAHILLGELETGANHLDLAADHLRKCEPLLLECSAKSMFLPFSNALGHYYEGRGDLELALSIFDTARKLAKNLTYLEWLWRFHASCGHILLRQKSYEGAVDQYRGGLVILEHIVSKLAGQDREIYMRGREKIALGDGLEACHQAIVRTKK
jgi:tetratricopeptide (TPR) repeat protein